MCEMKNREALRNGHAADPTTQGHALADILDAVSDIQRALGQIPTRSEVREMIHDSLRIHVESCDAARDDGSTHHNKFKVALAKFGLEAEGLGGVFFGTVLGLGLAWLIKNVAPYIGSWLASFFR